MDVLVCFLMQIVLYLTQICKYLITLLLIHCYYAITCMYCVAMLVAMLVTILLLFNFGFSIIHITYGVVWLLYHSS